MKDTLLSIIGQYIPFEADGIASLDIAWIFSAVLLISLVIATTWAFVRIVVGVLHD